MTSADQTAEASKCRDAMVAAGWREMARFHLRPAVQERGVVGCPWPTKIPYATQPEARRQLLQWRKREKIAGRLRVYRCGDHWHLGRLRARRRTKAASA